MARRRRSKQFKRSSRVIDMDAARQQRLEKRQREQIEVPQEQTTTDERKMRRVRALRRKQGWKRLVVFAAAVILIVFLGVSVIDIIKLKAEEHEVLKQQEQLKAQQEQLKEDLKEADNEQNIEDQAREKLKLTKPGETVYIPDSEEPEGTGTEKTDTEDEE